MLGIFLDTETNGLNAHKHKVLEIAFKILDVSSGELRAQFQTVVRQPAEEWKKSDPASLHINGFTWEEVCCGKSPEQTAQEILSLFKRLDIRRGSSVFICQNPSFDRAFFSQLIDADLQESLQWPYHWLDLASMYWAEGVRKGKTSADHFPWKTGVSKDKIARIYHLPSEGIPHRAMNGVDHLLLCYDHVVGFPCRQASLSV